MPQTSNNERLQRVHGSKVSRSRFSIVARHICSAIIRWSCCSIASIWSSSSNFRRVHRSSRGSLGCTSDRLVSSSLLQWFTRMRTFCGAPAGITIRSGRSRNGTQHVSATSCAISRFSRPIRDRVTYATSSLAKAERTLRRQ